MNPKTRDIEMIQVSPVSDSGTPIPSGQFCYEPVIDKRYNRWKRRRRKKKDMESRRPTITVESDSSDDDNERLVKYMFLFCRCDSGTDKESI